MPSNRKQEGKKTALQESQAIDPVNRRILTELADDVRLSTADLARRIGMSAPSVRERVRRLEEAGVIRGYRLDIDPAALGVPVAAWVRVRPGPGQLPKIAALAERTPQVSQCYRVSGEDCFSMLIHVPTIGDLEVLLDQFLIHGQTTSSFVVATPVPPRPVLDPEV